MDFTKQLSYGVTLAGLIQLFFLVYVTLKYYKPDLVLNLKLSSKVKFFFRKLLPSILSSGVTQINILVGTIIASFQSGAVSYLYYADRVYQINLAIAGIAVSTVSLPLLSKLIQNKKINVVVRQGHVQHTLRSWKNNILKGKLKHFKRQAENLPYDFFLMYGRYCNMKEPIFHELLKKQILQNSIYSCPAIENERLATSIEDISKAPPDSMRFAHDKNANTVITNGQKTKCHLVLKQTDLKKMIVLL